jgi:hypothetical protein
MGTVVMQALSQVSLRDAFEFAPVISGVGSLDMPGKVMAFD